MYPDDLPQPDARRPDSSPARQRLRAFPRPGRQTLWLIGTLVVIALIAAPPWWW